jgi:hypothetical protein
MVHDFPDDTDLLAELGRLRKELDAEFAKRLELIEEGERRFRKIYRVVEEVQRALDDLLRSEGRW